MECWSDHNAPPPLRPPVHHSDSVGMTEVAQSALPTAGIPSMNRRTHAAQHSTSAHAPQPLSFRVAWDAAIAVRKKATR